ncbi:class A beta-lactamase-related serine hydrolase [Anaerotruncus sp. 80]|uniref:Class A beta-lactamase-related serine hydrolase n=1 Tax=Anaerotruncus colihominis TaxID=169435 RepID=A0A845QHR5_9FIRM|nr:MULTISPECIES: serine hydrolase domain-containing protein [Anaerotruncus]NBH61439.1 class A beta-lactamase-related serine hydrolase [Anaerotruncus colihominis]NCF02094.1 class A beta-lactamase-related serine hydrolase [Anaerotruncus sp. 80]
MMQQGNLEQRLDAVIAPVMNEKTPGMALLIAKGDEILLRKAYGMADLENGRPITPEDNFVIASNTKQFTCFAILMLQEQGLLSLDETIDRFFPDFPPFVKNITVRQLMNHQSGIKEYFDDNTWQKWDQAACASTKDMLEIIKTFDVLDFEPDSQYSYSNSAYVMLGEIVSQLSGMPFGKFLEEKILKPVGMRRSCAPDGMDSKPASLIEGYEVQPDGSFAKQVYDMRLVGYADGNIQSNVDDMLTWHRHLYESSESCFLSREAMAESFVENHLKNGEGTGYGLGFFLNGETPGHKEIWHTGGTMGFISRCSRYVDDRISIIMLTNYEGLPKNQLYEKIVKEVFA